MSDAKSKADELLHILMSAGWDTALNVQEVRNDLQPLLIASVQGTSPHTGEWIAATWWTGYVGKPATRYLAGHHHKGGKARRIESRDILSTAIAAVG